MTFLGFFYLTKLKGDSESPHEFRILGCLSQAIMGDSSSCR